MYGLYLAGFGFISRVSCILFILFILFPYRLARPLEVQVDPLARLLEVPLHVVLAEAQEGVHADVQPARRLLGGREGRGGGRGATPGEGADPRALPS